MSSTALLSASSSPAGGSGFSGPTNAYGPPNSIYSTWTSAVASASAALRLSGYNIQTAIGSAPQSIDSIAITIHHFTNNATRVASATARLLVGTAPMPTSQTLTRSTTTGFSETVTFIGPFTWADMATLGVELIYGKNSQAQSTTVSVDSARIVVNYTPVPPPGISVKLRSGANGAFVDAPVFVRNGVNGPFVPVTQPILKRSGTDGAFS